MLSEQQRENIVHKLLSTWRYYEVKTSGRWGASIRKLCESAGFKKPEKFSFYIKSPNSEIITMANKIYDDTISHLRFSDFYTSENIVDFLKQHIVLCDESRLAEVDEDADPVYFWTDELEKKMESHGELIENTKIKLYKNSDAPGKTIDEIRTDLRRVQRLYNELYVRRHQFDHLTAEDIAAKLYTRYLYDNTFYTVEKKQIKGLHPFFLDSIASIVRRESITGTQFREIAHTSPWLQIYKTAQPNPFAGNFLSSDILQLMSLTRWYEWVRELGKDDRPSDKVMDDDDMLDGWYLLFERENKNKNKNLLIESNTRNMESFVMCNTPEEANETWRKNNKVAKSILQHRAKQIFGSDKGVKDQNLGDVQMDLQIAANSAGFKAAAQKARGR